MIAQHARFIEKGSGVSDSGPIRNELSASTLYLTVVSESIPEVSVKVLTNEDTANGEWFLCPINLLDGTVDDSISVSGLYTIPVSGAHYIKVVDASGDNTLEVFGEFDDA